MTNIDQSFAQSPLKLLETSPDATLKGGDLAVVMARAGVGKTACIVQFALDTQTHGENVFHVALGEDIDRVQSWYDTLFEDRKANAAKFGQEESHGTLRGERRIHTCQNNDISVAKLARTLDMYAEHTGFSPDMIIVDGFDWAGSTILTAATLGSLKTLAARCDAVLWMSAQTHRDDAPPPAGQLADPAGPFVELIDVALRLYPQEDHVDLGLVKDRSGVHATPAHVALHADTLRLASAKGEAATATMMRPRVCTLLSGAASGAEEVFGACAEKWGVTETNFSFEGRPLARERGVVMLNEVQLAQGNVSDRYLQEHMQRTYPKTPLFQKVLQSIWHEVNTANQVFVIGLILENGTVKGGTGWAAELAKHLKKQLYVYDQEKRSWFTWDTEKWIDAKAPTIQSRRFTGTGTRHLSDDGRAAIEGLYERSFGPATR